MCQGSRQIEEAGTKKHCKEKDTRERPSKKIHNVLKEKLYGNLVS